MKILYTNNIFELKIAIFLERTIYMNIFDTDIYKEFFYSNEIKPVYLLSIKPNFFNLAIIPPLFLECIFDISGIDKPFLNL